MANAEAGAGIGSIRSIGVLLMSHAAPLIVYARDSLELLADRLLRRIVAGFAILYGGEAVIGTALHVALAMGWVASPSTMAWGLGGGWSAFLLVAQSLTMVGLVVGGLLLLRRSAGSVALLRASVLCSIILTILSLATNLRDSTVYASYWSTPATGALYAMNFVEDLGLPVLIVLLTLPPLARRMV